jgi:hypothetical protein
MIATEEVAKLPPRLKPSKEFKASSKWVRGFRQRHMVSLRTPHFQRRVEEQINSVSHFYHTLTDALNSGMNKRFIVNADEKCWPVVFTNQRTWSPTTGQNAQIVGVVAKMNANIKQ